MISAKEYGLARGLKFARKFQNQRPGRWPKGQLYHKRHGLRPEGQAHHKRAGQWPECRNYLMIAEAGTAAFPVVFASFIVTDRQEFSP